jgi:hypothetical protein
MALKGGRANADYYSAAGTLCIHIGLLKTFPFHSSALSSLYTAHTHIHVIIPVQRIS